MLTLDQLYVNYGAIKALKSISCTVKKGEIVALIGANGAGKTTILNAISGIVPTLSGTVTFLDETISGIPPHEIVKRGISQVPEGRRVFANMSVLENLEMGAYIRNDKSAILEEIEQVFVRFPRLLERKKQLAKTLSGGEQQMLAMGRALMSRPKLLLLDEPSMGLAPIIVDEVFSTICRLKKAGITLLLVEQMARLALEVADYAYVMERGRIVVAGVPEELRKNERVLAAYLGS